MADGRERIVQQGFDEYVSLGSNCEVAFQLRRGGQTTAHFFDWASTPTCALIALLQDRFAAISADRRLDPQPDGMVLDHHYGYRFYGPYCAEKAAHLATKFLKPTGRRCYILKLAQTITKKDLRNIMRALRAINPDVTLVVLRHAKYASRPLTMPGVADRFLRRLAPLEDAHDGHIVSWDHVFMEFPLRVHQAV